MLKGEEGMDGMDLEIVHGVGYEEGEANGNCRKVGYGGDDGEPLVVLNVEKGAEMLLNERMIADDREGVFLQVFVYG